MARLVGPGPEIRETGDGGTATLSGDFAVFNQWTEIDSVFEGRFMESVAPGAFTKTIAENRDGMRILLNHGHDTLGNQPIAALTDLRETKTGAHYEADLLDGVPPLVLSGLRKGQYGSSFRFDVTRDDFEPRPKASAYNPDAIPERVIREARVFEFGPVTFPAYAGATAGVRSLTDEVLFASLVHDQRFSRALAPELLASIALVDSLIDQADEAINTVMDTLGIPDPDEADEPEEAGRSTRATWDTAYVNDLPDSAFAYIAPGGTKDDTGKTTPRSLRYFPHHDSSGSPDAAHVRNALARIPQSSLGASAKADAEAHVQRHATALGIGDQTKAALIAGITRKAKLIRTKAPAMLGAAKPAPRVGAPLAQPKFRSSEDWQAWLSKQ